MDTNFTKNVVDRLHLSERFEQIRPTTMEGNAIYTKYKNLFERYGYNVSGFQNFMLEGMNSNDIMLNAFAKSQSNNITLKCPTSWHFGIIMEQLEHSGNKINEAIHDELKYLLTYTESDLCEAIARGAFKNNMQVTGLRSLYESVTGDINARKLLEGSVMFHPISYIELRDGKSYFMVEGKVYEDDGEELKQDAPAPSAQFTQVNNVVQKIPYNPNVDGFVCNFLPAAVNITSNGEIFKDKESWDVQNVEDMVKQTMEDPNVEQEIKIQEARKFDDFKILMENFQHLVRLDNVTAVKNIHSGKSAYLFEGKKKNFIITESGIVGRCSTLNEAMGIFTRYSGVNLRGQFADKLNEEYKMLHQYQNIQESLDEKIKEAQKVVERCNEELKFCAEGTPKFQEFTSIKEDAQEYIKILQGTKSELNI